MAYNDDTSRPNVVTTILLGIALVIGLLFLLGASAAYLNAAAAGGFNLKEVIILSGLAIGVLSCIMLFYKIVAGKPLNGGGHIPQRERRSRGVLFGCLALGATLGLIMAATDGQNHGDFFANTPLPRNAALALAAIWGVIVPIITWFWLTRIVDEHEREAYRIGGEWAGHCVIIAIPTWWLLARGGFVAEPSAMAAVGILAVVWTAVWLVKKYS